MVGTPQRQKELYYDGRSIAFVNFYKHLGLFLTARTTFSNALDEMTTEGKEIVTDRVKTLWKLDDFSATIFFFFGGGCLMLK